MPPTHLLRKPKTTLDKRCFAFWMSGCDWCLWKLPILPESGWRFVLRVACSFFWFCQRFFCYDCYVNSRYLRILLETTWSNRKDAHKSSCFTNTSAEIKWILHGNYPIQRLDSEIASGWRPISFTSNLSRPDNRTLMAQNLAILQKIQFLDSSIIWMAWKRRFMTTLPGKMMQHIVSSSQIIAHHRALSQKGSLPTKFFEEAR